MKVADGALSRRGFLKLGIVGAAMTCADWRIWAAGEGLPAYYGDYLASEPMHVRKDSRKTCSRDARQESPLRR